jgi:uncharacterized damage-inducible protein DinB
VNDGLVDAFRHNAWATRALLDACGKLTGAQLEAPAPGTYGSVAVTLGHMIWAEGNYCARLTGEEPGWRRVGELVATLQELVERSDDLGRRWEVLLRDTVDAERVIIAAWPDGTQYDVLAGVYVAQALHHANEHRAQICVALSQMGVEPPSLGVWDYAEAVHRTRPSQR